MIESKSGPAGKRRIIRVLLADNNPVFREGFVSVLEAYPEFEVAGETADGLEMLTLADRLRPDVLVIDAGLLGNDGKINKLYQKIMPEFKVLVLTGLERHETFLATIEAGARGYISRDIEFEGLVDAVKAVATGHVIISADMAVKIAKQLERTRNNPEELDLCRLSSRQQEILQLVARGLTNKEIASSLFVSETTIKSHMRAIMEKFHAKNRGQAVARASRAGLLSNSP